MKLGFRGRRTTNSCVVSVLYDGEEVELLNPRTDLRNHSPTGFEWGFGGSGPAQLALAILAHEYGDEKALGYYQEFKWKVIAWIGTDKWELTSEEIEQAIRRFRKSREGSHERREGTVSAGQSVPVPGRE